MACKTEGQMDRRVQQFHKIYALDEMTNRIIETLHCTDTTEKLPQGSFLDVVDLNNAHMSLTFLMHMAEKRYADIVTTNLTQMDTIKEVVYEIGKEKAIETEYLDEATNYVLSNILDGMPCDQTINIIENNESRIVWEKIIDTHEPFWLDVNNYYILMECFVKGMLSKTSFTYKNKENEVFAIYK